MDKKIGTTKSSRGNPTTLISQRFRFTYNYNKYNIKIKKKIDIDVFTYGVQKRTPVRSKEDNRRPKRDSLNYADSMFRMNPDVSRLRIASDRAGSF